MMTLERAMEIAVAAHAGQQDRYGAPYIGHVMRVMNMGKTDAEKIVGVLHDVVEDTPWTFERLANEGLEPALIAALKVLPNFLTMKIMTISWSAPCRTASLAA